MSYYLNSRYLFFVFTLVIAVLIAPKCDVNAQSQKEWVIVIDPGHGGHDPGAVRGNIKEKDITLAIAKKLGKKLSLLENTKIIYTREEDVSVELFRRARIANENKADLFISIHCNAVESTRPYGAETWVMGLHKSKENLEVARRENAVILLEDNYEERYDGFDPFSPEAEIIFSLYQNIYLDQSVGFASLVQEELKNNAQRFDRGVKQAGFLVLFQTNMPGILIETGFISNANEAKYLTSNAGQNSIATSIYNAIIRYRENIDGSKPQLISNAGAEENKNNQKLTDTNEENLKNENSTDETLNADKQNNIDVKSEPDALPATYYTVQFLLSSMERELSDPAFASISHVHMYTLDGTYRYVSGYFKTIEEAQKHQVKIQNEGYNDAFIIALNDGKRITINEAKNLINN